MTEPETLPVSSQRYPSPLGKDVQRVFSLYNWGNGSVRNVWSVEGPPGVMAFQASPMVDSKEKANRLMEGSDYWNDSTLDGIPWIGWDLGAHHLYKPTDHDSYAHHDPCMFTKDICWYDGTSLGADNLLKKWLASHCDDELLFTEIERYYQAWMET
jgi:hypothetical protein